MQTSLIKASNSAARAAWARLSEKLRRGVVGQAYARVLDLLDENGEVPLLVVLATLFPEESHVRARLALKTQFSNRPPKLADGNVALRLKNNRVSLKGGAEQTMSFAKAVVWFEIPASIRANSFEPIGGQDVTEYFCESLARTMLGSEVVEYEKSKDLQQETVTAAQQLAENHPVALHAMLQWARATEPPVQQLLVLLGDYGTGKTSHGEQFTLILNNKISHPQWPHGDVGKEANGGINALFIDLSLLSGLSNLHALSLEEMLVLALKKRDGIRINHVVDIVPLLDDVRAGRLIIVFDGLDELLRTDGVIPHKMLEQILRVVEPNPNANTGARQPKAIISCRSHYFRDVEAQHNFFAIRRHEGITNQDYFSVTLLPWNDDLIESYLRNRFREDASHILKAIRNTYDLRELATRPVLLDVVSEHIQAQFKNNERDDLNAVNLYNRVVVSWIERDDGNHRIRGHQKPLLVGALAAAMFNDGVEAWPVNKLDGWLRRNVNLLFPGNYSVRELVGIQEDLRTAAFIVRLGASDFGFAHKSLSEYFLARFILDGVDQVRYGNMSAEQLHSLLPSKKLSAESQHFLAGLWVADCEGSTKRDTRERMELLVEVLKRDTGLNMEVFNALKMKISKR